MITEWREMYQASSKAIIIKQQGFTQKGRGWELCCPAEIDSGFVSNSNCTVNEETSNTSKLLTKVLCKRNKRH